MSKKISIILLLLCLGLFSQAQSYQKISQGVKTTVKVWMLKWHFILHPLSGFIDTGGKFV